VYRFFASQPHQITVVLVVLKASFYVIGSPLKTMRIIGVRQAPLWELPTLSGLLGQTHWPQCASQILS